MEVHAHSHTPRKKWTHYFWEFLNVVPCCVLWIFGRVPIGALLLKTSGKKNIWTAC